MTPTWEAFRRLAETLCACGHPAEDHDREHAFCKAPTVDRSAACPCMHFEEDPMSAEQEASR